MELGINLDNKKLKCFFQLLGKSTNSKELDEVMDTTTDCSAASDCWRWDTKHCVRGRKIIIADIFFSIATLHQRAAN